MSAREVHSLLILITDLRIKGQSILLLYWDECFLFFQTGCLSYFQLVATQRSNKNKNSKQTKKPSKPLRIRSLQEFE